MAQIVTYLEYQRTVPRWIPPAGPHRAAATNRHPSGLASRQKVQPERNSEVNR